MRRPIHLNLIDMINQRKDSAILLLSLSGYHFKGGSLSGSTINFPLLFPHVLDPIDYIFSKTFK